MKAKRPKLPGKFLILFGLPFFLVGFYLQKENLNKVLNGIKVKGTIARYSYVDGDDGGSYLPHISFQVDQQNFTRPATLSSSKSWDIGEEVEIYFLPEKKKVLINTLFRVYGFGTIFLSTGLLVMIAGFRFHKTNQIERLLSAAGKTTTGRLNSIKLKYVYNETYNVYEAIIKWQNPDTFKQQYSKSRIVLGLSESPPKIGDDLEILYHESTDRVIPKSFNKSKRQRIITKAA